MDHQLFSPIEGELDAVIERLVAKRLLGGLTREEEMELDRLVARRGARMMPARRALRRYA